MAAARRSKGPIVLNPWLVVAGAIVLYGLTLQHWVTLSSLPLVSKVTGWDWSPYPLEWRETVGEPLFILLTFPIRILPVAWQPFLLNAFTALCAAGSLGILAASVRLLPHDRTPDQRIRETGEYSLLSLKLAFIPQLLAVLVMAFYLTFWRNATAASNDVLNVLVFAFLIHCLLKFRISQNDNLLYLFAFIYGLGTTNNWALIGFFPLFLIALIWIKGVPFFNLRFVGKMSGLGLLGLLLYLLLPTMATLGSREMNFISVLHLELGAQSFGLFHSIEKWVAVVGALPTLLPLFFAGIKWPSFEGEVSAIGNTLTKWMFRLAHVFFLLLALLLFFDFKFSPGLRLQEQPVLFLTFFYVGALCIGYFSGFTLLVFGKEASVAWEQPGWISKGFNWLVLGLFLVLAVAAPAFQLYQNAPRIRAGQNHLLKDLADQYIQEVPAKGAIVMADDPTQLELLQAGYARLHTRADNILIETPSMPYREYIAYLVGHNEELKKVTTAPSQLRPTLPPLALQSFLNHLIQNHPIYYLNPSFGYYFEVFYMRPHGVVYSLQTYPKDTILPPAPPPAEMKENQDFWAKLDGSSIKDLTKKAALDPDADSVATIYSVALNYWGAYLQRSGFIKEARPFFAKSIEVNTNNYIAQINQQYNARLLQHQTKPLDTTELMYRAVNAYHGLIPLMKFNGPVDEPALDLDFGRMMAGGRDFRQAAAFFERRLQLLPGDPNAQIDLAKTFVDWGAPDKALELVRTLRKNPAADQWEVSRVEALAYYSKHDFASAEKLLQKAYQENPKDGNRVALLAEFYRVAAYTSLHDQNQAEANKRFASALRYFNEEIQLMTIRSHGAGETYGMAQTLLKKAEVEMMMSAFSPGVTTLNQIIDLEPENPTAVLNRAVAEVQLGKYDEARADYKQLLKILPHQRYVVDFGLADIASRQTNRTDEIHYLRRYVDTAPQDTPEYQQAKQRLARLGSH